MNKKKNTLDSYHKDIINNFNNKPKEYDKLIDKLKNKENELKLLEKPDNKLKNAEIKKKFLLKSDIKDIKIKIQNIENKKEESDYLLNSMDYLSIYFNKDDNKSKVEEEKSLSIIDFLNNKNNDEKNDLTKFVTKEKKFSKIFLFNEYLLKIDTSKKSKKNIKIDYVKNYTFCDNCSQEKVLIHSEALYVCYNCGECNHTLIDAEKPSYKEPIIEVTNFSYKRNNHFSEWLNKFQALESTTIPQEVYDKIMIEIKKEKIKDLKKINYNKMRQILKKISMNKYYEHIFHIINKINGVPPPKLSKELEDKLRIMFKKVQEPFGKFCPLDRTNFLSYSYVIRKFLQLLGDFQYIDYFQLLKSREKLHLQDQIWKQICNELGWKFFPSI
jgi:hypothetical protein